MEKLEKEQLAQEIDSVRQLVHQVVDKFSPETIQWFMGTLRNCEKGLNRGEDTRVMVSEIREVVELAAEVELPEINL